MNTFTTVLLAAWLIGQSLIDLLGLRFPYSHLLLPVLALAAGLSLLWPAIKPRINLGRLLLSLWLMLGAGIELSHYSFPHGHAILAIMALLSGFFLIIRK